MNQRHTIVAQHLKEIAAKFINEESNRRSLITITNAELSNSRDKITFFVSVFPEEYEGPALGFLMRKRGECKKYLLRNTNMKRIPHVEFAIDEGEKNRQKVDELLNK